ncbi:MAG: DUF1565 domain-containing protein [Phycisphaerae bacterium]|nr:DUF1565 domain-containing protein [Phycisphaerae bacterium]
MNSKANIWILLLCLMGSQAFAASVTWVDGLVPPSAWTIDPNNPGTSDTITFSGPLDYIYGSSCSARGALGGTPQITVDTVNKQVVLSIQGPPPTQCPAIWQPVSGLQGDFGPLPSGYWTFKCTVPAIAFNISFTVGTPASIYYVDQDAPGPVHNGANWLWAFRSLQDALSIAVPGDTILVAEGVYKPDQGTGVTPGDREASFLLQDGITLVGGHAGYGTPSPDTHDPDTFVTELSGDLAGDDLYGLLNVEENSHHVMTAQGPAILGTTIKGVVIKNGRANGDSIDAIGGGLLILDANVAVSDSLFYGNKGAFGGAAAIVRSSLTLVNSRISGNTAQLYGAGVYGEDSSITLTNCLITGNSGYQADFMIGSVVYGLNSSIAIHSSTVTDNLPSGNRTIASLSWIYPPTNQLTVTNSILYNGGNEIFTTHPSTTEVSHSDVQGGWTGAGTGNIDADPLFVTPGGWSFEGEWIFGDYHLQDSSPCIDQGSTALLPADVTDLDMDGNTAEPLPLDLDGAARIQGSQTDMGVYDTELIVTPPPVEPEWVVADTFSITHTPSGPWPSVRLSATITTAVQLNFKGELSLTIASTSAAGGNWTATFTPDPGVIGPGTYSVTLEIVGENVDLSKVTSGIEHDLAELFILVRPVQP